MSITRVDLQTTRPGSEGQRVPGGPARAPLPAPSASAGSGRTAGDPQAGEQQDAVERPLVDRFGRVASDLRISLIDKCNLRCTYCMPADGMAWLPKSRLLTGEEVRRLVTIGVRDLGVRELRLTGGEPLVRVDLVDIVAGVRADHPELPISLTTNAVGLAKKARPLAEAGLSRINVSLDTLHAGTFQELARRNHLQATLDGIDAAVEAGLGAPLKINTVLMRGVNDHEAADLLAWAVERGFELRFIEQMPLDADHGWRKDNMVTSTEIRERLAERFVLSADPRERDGAPAERFQVAPVSDPGRIVGTVGIIASVTEPFCSDCRRTRITAEGKVMACLFSREETDLSELLRSGATDDDVADRWREAMWGKPRAHGMGHPGLGDDDFVQPDRSMSAIGG
ncbi:GTP 3',8-cyclase MoaA [Zhihengliuella sp.]|uniref:GTP 3',8-cyclase MoaA n=1 Tax=Zhihengliuella sp. TaxID=1954483 RepID=UPI002811006F|nr:GTP 3',8-cyclase MoaA [Zhihengliuella sp.]